MKLSNNKIFITGGSAGIGLALAKRFVELNNKVIVTGRSESKLEEARQQCPQLETYVCDVSDTGSIGQLALDLSKDHPDLNALINNAGVYVARNLTGSPEDLAELAFEVEININGTVQTTAALIDLIKKNKGTIINVSSGLAFVPLMAAPIYSATKAFVHSYTTSLRYQLAEVGVDVIELAPPAVRTDLTQDLPDDGGFKIITTDELVDATMAGLKAGKKEIRPGQANQLKLMSRLAPDFVEGQLAKGSRDLVPESP
ncbi:MAG: SDR family NAD(P)-dependent oxidoreductase [Verrucomicrobiota bacterium]